MKVPHPYKEIVDAIRSRVDLDMTLQDELIDHYCTMYESLLPDHEEESALSQVIDRIHSQQFKSKSYMTNYIILLLLAFTSIVSFSIINTQENEANISLPIVLEVEPPMGNPLGAIEMDISSGFGMRRHPINKQMKKHTGIDLKAPQGTPVSTVVEGKVLESGYDNLYGYYIVIEHDDEYTTRYHHLEGVDVQQGQLVKKDEVIGRVGSTGVSTGPHLHYEVIKNGEQIDPKSFLGV